jgi:hypothetical protein
MTKQSEDKPPQEPLATLGAAARNQSKKPGTPTPAADQDTSYKSADLKAQEKDAADNAAIDHHAKTDKRAG